MQAETKEEKGLRIKALALDGDFAEIGNLYGEASLMKAKNYVAKKVTGVREKILKSEDISNENPFLVFAAHNETSKDIAVLGTEWKESLDQNQDIDSPDGSQDFEPPADEGISIINQLQVDLHNDMDTSASQECANRKETSADVGNNSQSATVIEINQENDMQVEEIQAPVVKSRGFKVPTANQSGTLATSNNVSSKVKNGTSSSGNIDRVFVNSIPKVVKTVKTKISKKITEKRSANEPKCAQSAFNLFRESVHAEPQEDGAERVESDVDAEVGLRWTALEVEERQVWTDAAKADKLRYDTEMKAYRESKNEVVETVGKNPKKRKVVACDRDEEDSDIEKNGDDGDNNEDCDGDNDCDDDTVEQNPPLPKLKDNKKKKEKLVTPTKAVKKIGVSAKKLCVEDSKKVSKKAKRDPLAPKGAKNAYMFFSQSIRAEVEGENPDLSMIQLAPKIAEKWKALEDDEKASFVELAAVDKTRYEDEMETYKAKSSQLASNGSNSKKRKVDSLSSKVLGSAQSAKTQSSTSSGLRSQLHRASTVKKLNISKDFSSEDGIDSNDAHSEDDGNDNGDGDSDAMECGEDSDDEDSDSCRPSKSKAKPITKVSKSAFPPLKKAKHQSSSKSSLPTKSNVPTKSGISKSSSSSSGFNDSITKKHITNRKPDSVVVPKGLKQGHLPPQLDLLHVKMIPRTKGELASEPIHATGTQVVLILAPYREFLSLLPVDLLTSEDMEDIQQVCSTVESTMYATISGSADAAVDTEHEAIIGAGSLKMVTITPMKKSVGKESLSFKVLSVGTASSLLKSDVFLLLKEKYNASLRAPYLHVGAQVRKLFAADPDPSTQTDSGSSRDPDVNGVWYEGNIYYVRKDIKTNPYNAVSVVWLTQERGTNDWLYSYTQTDCENSPWDLEMSQFVLAENMRPPIYPKAFRIGALTAEPILNFIKRYYASYITPHTVKAAEFTTKHLNDDNQPDMSKISNRSWPYAISMEDAAEFTTMFPNEEDQLDLSKITKLCAQGRYEGSRGTGILTLFADLQRMVNNGKAFNQCNALFQPWRLADMLDKELLTLRELLANYHPSMSMLLERVDEAREAEVLNSQEEMEAV